MTDGVAFELPTRTLLNFDRILCIYLGVFDNTTSACVSLRVIDNPAQQGDLTTRLGLKIEDPQFRITSNNSTITFLDQPGQCPLV